MGVARDKSDPGLGEYLRQAQEADGLIATRLYRKAAAVVAWLAGRCGVSPNILTLLSLAASLFGAGLLLLPVEPKWVLATAVLVLLAGGYVLDCADGQLARACDMGSVLGKWLDHTTDCFKLIVLNACFGWVAIRYCQELGHPIGLGYLAASLHLAGNMTYFFGWNYKVSLIGSNKTGGATPAGRSRKLMMLPLNFTDTGVFVFICLLLPFQAQFLWVYLGYGIFTFLTYSGYLVLSARAMAVGEREGDR